MKKLLLFGLVAFLLIGLSSMAVASSVPSGGLLYYNLSSMTDLWSSYTPTNQGTTSISDFPSFNISGDSSPSSSNFDGSSHYIDMNFNPTTVIGDNQEWALSLWLKSDGNGGTRDIIWSNQGDSGATSLSIMDNGSIRCTSYDGSGVSGAVSPAIVSNTWIHVVCGATTSNSYLYVDGVYYSGPSFGGTDWFGATNSVLGINRNLAGEWFDGKIDVIKFYDIALNQTQVNNLFNYNNISYTPPLVSNFTITASDIWSSSAINTFNATVNGTLYTTTNGTITTDILDNATSTYTVLIEATDYFDRTYTDYNVSTNLNAELSQSQIKFRAFPTNWDNNVYIFSDTAIPGNFTIDGVTKINDTVFNLSTGTYNVTFSSNSAYNWYNATQEISVSPLDDTTLKFSDIYNSKTNLSFTNRHDGAAVEDVNTLIYSEFGDTCIGSCPSPWTELGYVPYYSKNITFNGSSVFNLSTVSRNPIGLDIQLANYTLIVSVDGYFPFNTTINTTSGEITKNIQLGKIGSLNLTVLDSETNESVGEDVNLTVESDTEQLTFTLTNGQGIIEGLTFDTNYTAQFESASYNEAYYDLFYNEQVFDFYYYMRQDGTNITVTVTDVLAKPLDEAQVVIERFVNGTYNTIGSRLTDIQGLAFFNIVQGDTHRVSVIKDGYITQEFTTQFLEGDIEVVLEQSTQVDYEGDTSGIVWDYSPSEGVVSGVTVFTWNVTATNDDLSLLSVKLYNGSSLISSNSSTSSTGDLLTITLNTSLYAKDTLTAVYRFQKTDFDPLEIIVSYPVEVLYDIDAGIPEFRTWVATNTSLTERIILLTFLTLVFALFLTVVKIPAVANVPITGLLTMFLAYVLVLDLFVVGVVVLPMIMGGLVLASKLL